MTSRRCYSLPTKYSDALKNSFLNPQHLIRNSPYYLLYNSYDVSLEDLVSDQLTIPLLIFFFILTFWLPHNVLILWGEILFWSITGVKEFKRRSVKNWMENNQILDRSAQPFCCSVIRPYFPWIAVKYRLIFFALHCLNMAKWRHIELIREK